ncbi:hypothetical protein VTJ83DRAFT_3664 [Remersonia thermophila]|uniref:Apple domain-containing protein n=1 Tax=Remersonia thermophila TaxID=72144 RepID=A0ABR4DEM6_9PEZI
MAPSSHRGSPSHPLPSISDTSNDLDLSPQRVRFAEGEPQVSYRIPQQQPPPPAAIGVAITTPNRSSIGPSVFWDDGVSAKDVEREGDANLAGYTFYREPTPPLPGEDPLRKETGYGAVRGGAGGAAGAAAAAAGGGGGGEAGGGLAAPVEPNSVGGHGGGGEGGGGGAGINYSPRSGSPDPNNQRDWSIGESSGLSPKTKKRLLWVLGVLGLLVIVGIVTGVVLGLFGVRERNGSTIGSQNLPTSSLPPAASDLGRGSIGNVAVTTDAPTATSPSTDGAAMPTATTIGTAPGRPIYNSDCPGLNNTIYHVPGSTKSFRRYCGIDYGGGTGALDLAHAWTTSMAECMHTCASFNECTACAWGYIPGDQGGKHRCYMKKNLKKPHQAASDWCFAILQT